MWNNRNIIEMLWLFRRVRGRNRVLKYDYLGSGKRNIEERESGGGNN